MKKKFAFLSFIVLYYLLKFSISMKSRTLSPPSTIVISLIPDLISVLMTLYSIGSLKTGKRCLFVTFVKGDNRDPVPPARINPLICYHIHL